MGALPNLFIVGAAKSGTTSLADYLKQHPEVFFSEHKEPNFFALEGENLCRPGPVSPDVLHYLLYKKTIVDYQSYVDSYADVSDELVIGDASVRYLYYEKAPERIKRAVPDAKIVMILREPVSRLYSHYCMNVQYQIEPLALEAALMAESDRINLGWEWDWHYVSLGKYARQIQRYYDLFDRAQIKVFLYDDFVADPRGVYRSICEFVGVNTEFIPDMSKRGKVAYKPKNLMLDRWLHWPNRIRSGAFACLPNSLVAGAISVLENLNAQNVPKLDSDLKNRIGRRYFSDFSELEDVLGRELPWGYNA